MASRDDLPAGGRRHGLFARIARIIVALGVVAVVLVAVVPPVLSLGPGRRLAEYALTSVTGLPTTVGRFRTWWIGDVAVERVRFHRSPAEGPFLTCRRIAFGFDFTRPIREMHMPSTITVDEPVLTLEAGGRGGRMSAEEVQADVRRLYRIRGVTAIRVSGGRLVVREGRRRLLTCTDVQGAVRLDRNGSTLSVDLQARRRAGEGTAPVSLTAALKVHAAAREFAGMASGPIGFDTPGLRVSLRAAQPGDAPGATTAALGSQLDLEARLDLAEVYKVLPPATPPQLLSCPGGTVTLAGRLAVAPDGKRRWSCEGGLRNLVVQAPSFGFDRLEVPRVEVLLVMQSPGGGRWNVSQLAVKGAESRLFGSGEVSADLAGGTLKLNVSGTGPPALLAHWLLWEAGCTDPIRLHSQASAEFVATLAPDRLHISGEGLLTNPAALLDDRVADLPDRTIRMRLDSHISPTDLHDSGMTLRIEGDALRGDVVYRRGALGPEWDMRLAAALKAWSAFLGRLYPGLPLRFDGNSSVTVAIANALDPGTKVVEKTVRVNAAADPAAMALADVIGKATWTQDLGKTLFEMVLSTDGARYPMRLRALDLATNAGTLRVTRAGPGERTEETGLVVKASVTREKTQEILSGIFPQGLVLRGPLLLDAVLGPAEQAEHIRFTLTADSVRYGPSWQALKPEFAGAFKDGKLTVKLKPATVAEGTLSAGLSVDFAPDTPTFEFKAQTEKVRISQEINFLQYLVPVFSVNEGKFSALMTADLSLTGSGLRWDKDMMASLKGTGKVSLTSGQVVANGLTVDFLKLIGKPDRYTFNSVEVQFDMDGGKIHHRAIRIDGDPFNMVLVGWIGLDGSIRYELNTDILKRNLKRPAIRVLSRLTADPFKSPFIIYGTVRKPRVYVTWLEGTGLDELLAKVQEQGGKYTLTQEDRERGLKALERLLGEIERLDESHNKE